MKKISVILPVHNGEKYISEAIDSILRQDYSNFELFILDDGSTDQTPTILGKYCDEKRIFVHRYERIGLISILNEGLNMCKGDFIARMDADDISLPNRFSTQLKYFERSPKLGVVGSGTYIINAGGFIKYGTYPSQPGGINSELLNGNFICHPSVMFKSDLVQSYGQYDSAYLHAEDYELWLRYSQHTEINNTNERLLIYREHGDNISFKKFPHQNMTAEIAKYIYKHKKVKTSAAMVDFETLKAISSADEFMSILFKWKSDVNSMINTGKIRLEDIDNYFVEYLIDSK